MQVINTVAALRQALKNQADVALVPTMGNLHAGHVHLVEVAKNHAKCVVVSIFVNPLQFGRNEDLASYPRTLEADLEKLQAVGASIVFVPTVEEMYPDFDGNNLNQTMAIMLPPIANELCGASRPGHFSGVATIVTKLFNMVMPQVAVFGKKDFQQLFIIKQLVKQFNFPIEIFDVATVRETTDLAMSSRNNYLTTEQRSQANQLNKVLQDIVNKIKSSENQINKFDFRSFEQAAIATLTAQHWLVDYISIRSALTLSHASSADEQLVVLAAAKLGNTRLIDNIEFCAK